ncbi:MAG TPA: DUF4351 domain-containing protein [Blastocatellia bacterium]
MSNFFDDAIQEGLQQGLNQGIQQGIDRGLKEGRRQGAESLIVRLLEKRIGSVSARSLKRIRSLPADQLDQLGVDLLNFGGPRDLAKWLTERIGH